MGGLRNRLLLKCCQIIKFEDLENALQLSQLGWIGREDDLIAVAVLVGRPLGLDGVVGEFDDFGLSPAHAILMNPPDDFLVGGSSRDKGFEMVPLDPLETEEDIIERAIEVVVANRAGQVRAALVDRPR